MATAERSKRRLYLAKAPPGRLVRVQQVRADGPLARRLMEMGFVEGAQLRVVGKVPFGDPLHVRVGGYDLSLRRQEAELVEVVPV